MKRFKVTNRENGMKFAIDAEVLPPNQPEWGANPLVEEADITAEEDAKKAKKEANRAKLKDLSKVNTVAECKAVLMALVEELGLDR